MEEGADAETLQWFGNLAERGFQICLISNSGQQERVMAFGRLLNVVLYPGLINPWDGLQGAKKSKQGRQYSRHRDQIFTDVLVATMQVCIQSLWFH